MTPEQRHQRVTDLLSAALDHAPDERTAFLHDVCDGDEELLREIESLLASFEQSPSFIEKPAMGEAAKLFPASLFAEDDESLVGQRIGVYQIVREIGRGGMGAVYLAERADEQFREKVALKIIKRGMDTREVVRRFRHERQIMASLHHPNIAALLDGGTTEDGLPYFVMEFIEGEPIDVWCNQRQLAIVERLKLFRTVCAAVHYAHQNLVIHRDIKPSNILVTADGTLKLLDFGIAKILNPEISQTVEKTATLMRLMTPEYASPEQVRGETVTTATDIYSLGVVLYELLTGHRPYRLTSILPSEIERIICEQEPARPSTVITRNEERTINGELVTITPESVSHTREGQPEKLRRRLRGDLDNLVLLALRKEASRRYASVEHFSEDIRRHLVGLPVHAHGDSLSYRTSKFVRRHKAGVAAAALVLLSLIAGLITTIWQARRAQAAQARAERRFNDVRALANAYLFEFHDKIVDLQGTMPARQLLVQRGLQYLDSLSQEASNDPALQSELSTAYAKLGDLQGHPAFQNLGDHAGALASYQKALALAEAAHAERPNELKYKNIVARINERIGDLLLRSEDINGAGERFARTLKMREELLTADPGNPQYFYELSVSYDRMGYHLLELKDANGALEYFRKGMKMGEETVATKPNEPGPQRDLAVGYQNLGKALSEAGRWNEALSNYQQALAISQALSKSHPENAEYRRDCQIYLRKVGEAQVGAGDFLSAVASYQQSQKIAEELVVAGKGNNEASLDLALINTRLGEAWSQQSQRSRNKSDWQQARHWLQRGLNEWQSIKQHGALPPEHEEKLTAINRDIAKCDAALAK